MYIIRNDYLTVTVDPYGAQLMSILAADGTEFLWQGDPKYWKDRSPNLFPTVSRLTDGVYQLDGNWYEMGLHGFARHSMFTVAKAEDDYLELQLTDSPETLVNYPRKFLFTIAYKLEKNTLQILFKVENRSDKEMPFAVGGHPGFNVPLAPGKEFEDYYLRFSEPCKPETFVMAADGRFYGETALYPLEDDRILRLKHSLFEIDGVFLLNAAKEVTLEAEGEKHSVTVSYPDMHYVGFWHAPYPDTPYVCIEPWSSMGSTSPVRAIFEEKKDMMRVAPGKTYENHWSIRCDF